jgi:hypothetical protein
MIYIIHFDKPYYHARHYVGYCADGKLEDRLARHRKGRGSRLMLAVETAGLPWKVVATHPGDRNFERSIKRAKNTPRFCPVCHPTLVARPSTRCL